MSRERALRRAAREAETERRRVRHEKARERAARRRALAKRLAPRRGRTGRLYARRALAQRIGIGLVAALAVAAVWWQFEDLATRLALTVVIAVAAPAAVVLTFDRRT
ncbi:MAG: hypothetical protein AUG44_18970 [Actinobacteria bacterium 13_1_20CM_3_71_11]|nr:MAG: hypothetical protein AUG44_18970 [Actinobacteria bacterium 13_1_20CM_3_71_11]